MKPIRSLVAKLLKKTPAVQAAAAPAVPAAHAPRIDAVLLDDEDDYRSARYN